MSKVWKGIKKVFKKVVEVAKKVVPIVLAVAAVYFTAGAALGWAGAAGGWTGVGASVGSAFGEGIVASTVAGAVTSAGTGAAIGGAVSAAMGGSFTEGAQAGALSGAVIGGIGGAIGYTPPTPEVTDALPPPTGALTPQAGVGADGQMLGDFAPGAPAPPANGMPPTTAAPPPPGAAATGASTTYSSAAIEGSGKLGAATGVVGKVENVNSFGQGLKDFSSKVFGDKGWLERNQTLAGGAIQGIGMGLSANAAYEGEEALLQKRQDIISANYAGADPGANFRKLSPGGPAPRQDRYDPRSYGSWEYQYDPEQGRIIKVPVSG